MSPGWFRGVPLGVVLALVVTGAALPVPASAQAAAIDPQAVQVLRSSTSFLAAQKRFTVVARNTLEIVLASGQKLQLDHAAQLGVERPNRLRAERRGELADQVFRYDGKTLTLYERDANAYASVAAPATLDETLDFATDKLGLFAPGGDLLYSNVFDVLMTDVTEGFVVGKAEFDGVACTHLAFRAPHVDWQIWIQDGKRPLPRKLVITSKGMAAAPQFVLTMSGWNLAPKFDAKAFAFVPPKGAQKIEFLPPGGAAPR